MRFLALHLEPGSDVRQALEELARQEGCSGFVLSVVGNLSQAAFQCPGQADPTVLRGELEIITLQGTLAPEGVHLHLSFSDGACQVWGGHLEPGSQVLKGADLLVGMFDPAQPDAALPVAQATVAPTPVSNEPPRVEIAVLPGCPYSARALRMLRTLGIPHRVSHPQEPGRVPQIFIDGQLIGGYDALADLHARGSLEVLREF
ncbi:PCC domain-containing protein [Aphanothece microscopica]